MSTTKQERKMARKFQNPVEKHMRTFNKAVVQMDKRFKQDSRKNKSWKNAI